MVIHSVLDGRKDGEIFIAGISVRSGWVNANVNVLRMCSEREEQKREGQADKHGS
jgi:hypothetical protein